MCSTSPVAQAQITPTEEMMAPSAYPNGTGRETVERYPEDRIVIVGGRLSNSNQNPQI
jgi:hypothetical protein